MIEDPQRLGPGEPGGGSPAFEPSSSLVDALHPSPNVEPRRPEGRRPDILLLHYTGLPTVERAIAVLADPVCKVSCHYVIDLGGRITQMVPESLRAWHAGVSVWDGESDINSASIGIEIHNVGHDAGYPPFPIAQMEAVAGLCLDIVARHAIPPERVLAHSDIAPGRKIDPGEKFDWAWLAARGVGHWVEPVEIAADDEGIAPGESAGLVGLVQAGLAGYGYGVAQTGVLDPMTETVVRAFQRHFRPARVDGRIDTSTALTLERLLGALARAKV